MKHPLMQIGGSSKYSAERSLPGQFIQRGSGGLAPPLCNQIGVEASGMMQAAGRSSSRGMIDEAWAVAAGCASERQAVSAARSSAESQCLTPRPDVQGEPVHAVEQVSDATEAGTHVSLGADTTSEMEVVTGMGMLQSRKHAAGVTAFAGSGDPDRGALPGQWHPGLL